MRTHRWPALTIIVASLVGAVAYARGGGTAAPTDAVAEARIARERAVPHLRADGGSERWFCGGGGAGAEAPIAQQLVLTNAGHAVLQARITVLRDPTDVDRAPVLATRVLEPGTTVELPVEEVLSSKTTGAVVEGDGAGLVVEQRVVWAHGAAVGSCASSASDAWFFAGGATTRDATYRLTVLNPFPDDAVVDVTIETDEGTRVPNALQGLVVPGRSVVPIDVAEGAQRREMVAVAVRARSGRIVVHRVHGLDGSVARQGLSVSLGSTAPALTWVFPYVSGGVDTPARYAVYNTDQLSAEVDVELRPDDPDRLFDVEPFAITVAHARFAIVDLGTEDAAARVPDDVTYAAMVLGQNNVPVIAEQWMPGQRQLTLVGGIPVQATAWTVPAVPGAATDLGIVNVSPEAIAQVTVERWTPTGWVAIEELQGLEVGPGRRLVILADDVPQALLRVSSSAPVVVGRRVSASDTLALLPALPTRGSSSDPDPYLLAGSP